MGYLNGGVWPHDVASKISFVRPWLPPFVNEARILNLQIANATVDLAVLRHEHNVSVKVLRRSGDIRFPS